MEVKQTQLFTLAFNSNSPITATPIDFNFPSLSPSSDLVELVTKYTLKSFRCKSIINSLAPIPFPDIPLTSSQSETLITTLNLEWGNPRIQLDVVLNDGSGNYNSIGAISLINISPYPYRNFDLLSLITDNDDLSLNSGNLAILISDAGFGFLGTGDSVNVWCEVEQTTYLHALSQSAINNVTIPTPTINLNVDVSGSPNSSGSTSSNPVTDINDMPLTLVNSSNSPYNVVAGSRYFIDASAGSVQVNFPATPNDLDEIELIVYGGAITANFGTNQQFNTNGSSASGTITSNSPSSDAPIGGRFVFHSSIGWLLEPGNTLAFSLFTGF